MFFGGGIYIFSLVFFACVVIFWGIVLLKYVTKHLGGSLLWG